MLTPFVAFPFTFMGVGMAENQIVIEEDEIVNPQNSPIMVNGSLYVFQSDFNGSLIIKKGGVIIDGNGFTLRGQGFFQSKGITLDEVSNVTIKNFKVENFYYGIWLYNANFNIVAYNTLKANTGRAIMLRRSNNNVIFQNIIVENKGRGIMLENSNNNLIEDNQVIENGCDPIIIDHSNNNCIKGNLISKNNGRGIWLGYSFNNSLVENKIIRNSYSGIQLYHSMCNNIFVNTVAHNNVYGIQLLNASLNHIYNNNFIDNTLPVNADESLNFWDNGYYNAGNYWSHLNISLDFYRGIMQNETGSDGIIDEPYKINENNIDTYPLIGVYSILKISYTNFSVGIVTNCEIQSFIVTINRTIMIKYIKSETSRVGRFRLWIPHEILGPPYVVRINDQVIDYSVIIENETLSILYFYSTAETSEIIIIPENLRLYVVCLFLVLTLYTIKVRRLCSITSLL
ncbi:MAG: NosD domain-containing protein [Nitrososphaerota archaeon]